MAQAARHEDTNTPKVAPVEGAMAQGAQTRAPAPANTGGRAGEQVHDEEYAGGGRGTRVWWVATGLLVLMAAVFGVTTWLKIDAEWVRMVRAFSEAAMVGALADWFAVTALFRRPLGLPIPHTGIVPMNKARIGRSLGIFVQRNFLTEEVLDGQVVNISGSFARFLQNPANRERIVERIKALVPQVLEVASDGEIKSFLNQQVEDIVRRTNLTHTAARFLRTLTANQMHEVVLDEAIHQLQSVFRTNQLWFRYQLREATPWFVPEFVDRRIFDAITNKTEQTLAEALANKNHELRQRLLAALYNLIVRLETSEDLHRKGEEFKQVLLSSDVFREYLGALRDAVIAGVDTDVKKRDSVILAAVQRILQNLVDTLSQSPSLQRKLNRFTRSLLSTLVGKESTFVADLIAKTIDGWDSKTLVAKLEEQVGADLQYIRINGTLVGGLVGLLLYGISSVLSGR